MPQLTIVPEYHPTTKDVMLEYEINSADRARFKNTDPSKHDELEQHYRKLHDLRSDKYIAWDEKRKGLRQ